MKVVRGECHTFEGSVMAVYLFPLAARPELFLVGRKKRV